MMRSRVTLAMIEAAAIDRQRASPLTIVRGRTLELGRAVAVDGHHLRRHGELGDGLRHGPHGGVQYVLPVDALHVGDADADDGGRADAHEEDFARLLVEHFAVVDAVGDALRIEDDGSGDDRPCERPAPRLIDAGDRAAVELQLCSFQLERRQRTWLSIPHGPARLRGSVGKSKPGPPRGFGKLQKSRICCPASTGRSKRSVRSGARSSLRPSRLTARRKRSAICSA